MHPGDRHGHLIPDDGEHAAGCQDSGGLEARTLRIHPVPGLRKHDDVIHVVRQTRLFRDAIVPRDPLDRRGLGSHHPGGFDRVHEETAAGQELAHLAGARADVGGAQWAIPAWSVHALPAPRGVDQRGHGLVRVGGAHRVVGATLPDVGIHLEGTGHAVRHRVTITVTQPRRSGGRTPGHGLVVGSTHRSELPNRHTLST